MIFSGLNRAIGRSGLNRAIERSGLNRAIERSGLNRAIGRSGLNRAIGRSGFKSRNWTAEIARSGIRVMGHDPTDYARSDG